MIGTGKRNNKNREYLAGRARGAIECYRECIDTPSKMLLIALAILEAGLCASDVISFGQLFGQMVGDAVGTVIALFVSLLFPAVVFIVLLSCPAMVAGRRNRMRIAAGVALGTAALGAATIALRFALLSFGADDGEANPWALEGVAYSLPLIASVVGSIAAGLVLNDPIVKAKVGMAKLKMAIAEREAELRAHECNDPRDLRQRVLGIYRQAELQTEAMFKASVAASLPAISAAHGLSALDLAWDPLQPVLGGDSGGNPDALCGKMPFGAFGPAEPPAVPRAEMPTGHDEPAMAPAA